jgi:hypothetical protein
VTSSVLFLGRCRMQIGLCGMRCGVGSGFRSSRRAECRGRRDTGAPEFRTAKSFVAHFCALEVCAGRVRIVELSRESPRPDSRIAGRTLPCERRRDTAPGRTEKQTAVCGRRTLLSQQARGRSDQEASHVKVRLHFAGVSAVTEK